ncbi:MAG TPA: isocitrate lyase/phosphoenolpyruvate mutase family protein [Candidatus Dormibacteraeota bacterium]|jgi:2-methylisocitrate lyase-like PEP mutase family enzyme|nr:isocitrate lyase/phosphoenolpyruvate mutase family protein [Candidatus Dormibacteraeota bacterium]
MTPERADLATTLLRLHRPGEPLVLVNVWDPGSARVVAAAGAPAIATGSAGVSHALGRPDGEMLSREEMLAAVRAVAASVPVPVTADMEAGYGGTPAEVGETMAMVLDAGAVGVNIEDSDPSGAGVGLVELEEQRRRLGAARARAEREGVHLVINARCDAFWRQAGDPATRLAGAVERANAYLDAGADCAFFPGAVDPSTIAALVQGVRGPVNVLATPASPTIPELAALGVGRVSLGSWPARAALTLLSRIATEVPRTGRYDALQGAMSYADAQALFSAVPTPHTPRSAGE